jgi:RNA polymerase sigma factor (sigma-70 family)
MSDVTRILSQIEQRDPQAAEKLLPLVYDELRKLAAVKLAQEKPGQTLQATALVHEAYLRLVGPAFPAGYNESSIAGQQLRPSEGTYNTSGHFFAAAAEAMRRILVDEARRKHALKRGGHGQRLELIDVPDQDVGSPIDLLGIDQALTELAAVDARAAELVKIRYFAGLSAADAASALGISARTADRIWLYARTWLLNKLASD